MALILDLGSNRTDEDSSTYDFHDLDDIMGDNGIWNFENADNDDTDGDPNNNALLANFDFGGENGVDPDSYIVDDSDIDMLNFIVEEDEDPTEEFEYGEIDNDTKYSKNDPLALEYDFGSSDEYPDRNICLYITKLMKDATMDALSNGNFKVQLLELDNPLVDQITFQYHYNYQSNKAYIEYQFSDTFKKSHDTDMIKKKINSYIHSNFKYDTGYFPEILYAEDGVNERVDGSPILTPFTVGYWKSLTGKYEFLEDETKIFLDMRQFRCDNHNEEFIFKKDALYEEFEQFYKDSDNQYETEYIELLKSYGGDPTIPEFEAKAKELSHNNSIRKSQAMTKFLADLYILYQQYHIDPDKKSQKTFKDFCDLVEYIDKSYQQTRLSESDKLKYFKEYNDLYIQYHNDSELFKEKLDELKFKYSIAGNRNTMIPDMFQNYKKAYHDFFNKELPEINGFVYKKYLQIYA